MIRLNLGAGRHPLPDFINLDGANGDCIYPLDIKQADEIRASHVLEHFSIDESIDVLANWIGTLVPGGLLRVAVPDFTELCRLHFKGNEQFDIEAVIMGGQVDERDYHKSLWTNAKLRHIMEQFGLTDIKTWQSEIQDCASLPFSLNLMGRKK